MTEYSKKGYLKSNFKVFHLVDENLGDIDFHYHDFHKLLIHLKGNTSYCIDGQTFDLNENDIVFVNAGEVHRPIFHDNSTYERIIIYISPDFLRTYMNPGNDLTMCFKQASEQSSHVLRLLNFWDSNLGSITKNLEKSLSDSGSYANELYQQILFLEFMVQLNRAAISHEVEYISTKYSNSKISAIIDFINTHITENLSVDSIANEFFISRYYLMHTFKEETGYTLGSYITTKKLSLAQSFIDEGMSINEAGFKAGFNNYTTFLRAYKKNFGYTPSNKTPSEATLRF